MGDVRFREAYEQVASASDRGNALQELDDGEVIAALAHASTERDALLANVLATEAMNRVHRARTVVTHAAEALVAVDAAGRATLVNPAACALLGWPRGALVGKPFHHVVPVQGPDSRELGAHENPLVRAATTGRVVRGEDYCLGTRDGRFVPVAFVAAPVHRDGEPEGAVIAFRDISHRKEAERALREQHTAYAAILSAQSDLAQGVLSLEDERVTHVNSAFLGMLGLARDDVTVLGDVLACVHEEDRDRVEGLLRGLMASPPAHAHFNARLVPREGGVRHAEVASQARAREGGTALIVLVRDITARARGEAERERLVHDLREERRLLQAVVDKMPVGVSIAEAPSGRLILHNEEAVRVLRHPLLASESYAGYAQYGALHPDGTPYAPEEYPIARAIIQGESVYHETMLYRRGDGTLTWFAVSATPLRDDEGNVTAAVSTFFDLTEQMKPMVRVPDHT